MAGYPDWVLAHKKKGTYINCVKGKYYLYAAHSERIPGTKKVRRVSDGYIGRITEEDGLIPAKDKVVNDVVVYEYGLHMTALAISAGIYMGLARKYRTDAERILVAGILLATGGTADESGFKSSYLSVAFPEVSFGQVLTDKLISEVERCKRMVADKLSGVVGGNVSSAELARIHAVIINGKEYISKKPTDIEAWLNIQKIEWGVTNWKKQQRRTVSKK
jgi:hypothetical protein